MKKIFAVILIALFASTAMAAEFRTGSGTQTTSAAIVSGPGILTQIIVSTDGTNNATITLYDHAASPDGTQLLPAWVVTSSAVDRIQSLPIDNLRFFNGIYAKFVPVGSGTGSYVILYQK